MTDAILSRVIDAALLCAASWCFATGCGTQVATLETILECHYTDCPSLADVRDAVSIFADFVELDRRETITVEWHAPGEVFAEWYDEDGLHQAFALTANINTVQVSSWALLAHELMHVRYWRADGDPDSTHAVSPGPWSSDDDTTINDVIAVYHLTFSGE